MSVASSPPEHEPPAAGAPQESIETDSPNRPGPAAWISWAEENTGVSPDSMDRENLTLAGPEVTAGGCLREKRYIQNTTRFPYIKPDSFFIQGYKILVYAERFRGEGPGVHHETRGDLPEDQGGFPW